MSVHCYGRASREMIGSLAKIYRKKLKMYKQSVPQCPRISRIRNTLQHARTTHTHTYVYTDMAPLFLTRLFCLHRFRSASTHLTPPHGRRLLKFLIYIFVICCCATLCNVACHTRAHTHYNMKCCCWYAIAAGSI